MFNRKIKVTQEEEEKISDKLVVTLFEIWFCKLAHQMKHSLLEKIYQIHAAAAKRLVKYFLQHAISNGQIDTQKRSKV